MDASRTLNPYCTRRKIKLEDLSHVPFTVRQGDFCVVNDLDSGYWHIPIAREHWQFLGVHFVRHDGSVLYWVWKVLCLGLRDAAFIFTKVLSPLVSELRKRGERGLIYIDDKLTLGASREECLYWEEETKALFEKAGLVFKPSKRSGDPAQVCKFLGLNIDTRDLTFNIPEEKILKIISRCKGLLSRKWLKVKQVASLVGLLHSVSRATGPIVSVLTRSLYSVVNSAKRWDSYVRLGQFAIEEVEWWLYNIRTVSKFPINGKLSSVPASYRAEVASDGSGVGYFVYELSDKTRLVSRPFTQEESLQSSTYRELVAFHDIWTNKSMLERFSGKRVTHFTDSKAMVFIINGGSRNMKLQPLVVQTILALREFNIVVEPVWISRDSEVIKIADMGSRDFHGDDIEVDFETFLSIERAFGSFDVDCFASASNAKCDKFFSKLDVLGSDGLDFFTQSLDPSENHWIFPPVGKLCQVVWQLADQKVSGVILLPVWPKSSFFSFFFPDGVHLAAWVAKVLWVHPWFVCGPLVVSKGLRGRKKFDSVAIMADFRCFDMEKFYVSRVEEQWCRESGCKACL